MKCREHQINKGIENIFLKKTEESFRCFETFPIKIIHDNETF
jgi:hypothetical protein